MSTRGSGYDEHASQGGPPSIKKLVDPARHSPWPWPARARTHVDSKIDAPAPEANQDESAEGHRPIQAAWLAKPRHLLLASRGMQDRSMRRLWPLLLVTATIALAGGANAQLTSQPHASPSSNNCEAAAAYGGGQAGCTWTRSFNLGPMPGEIYWHIDRFSDVPTAEAARTLYGSVTVALGGQVFLQTINDNPGWTAPGGERLALVGPLRVPSGPDLEARLMEVTAPVSARLDSTSGPKAMFVLGGSICLETSTGVQDIVTREAAIFTPEISAEIASRNGIDGRALLLVIYPTNTPWVGQASDWKPAGLCLR